MIGKINSLNFFGFAPDPLRVCADQQTRQQRDKPILWFELSEDRFSAENDKRYTHEEVFANLRRKING